MSEQSSGGSFFQTVTVILVVICLLLIFGIWSASKQEKRAEFSQLFQWGAYLKTFATEFYLMNDRYATAADAETIAADLPPRSAMVVNWLPDGVIQVALPTIEGVVEYHPRWSGSHFLWDCKVSESAIDMAPDNCRTIP